MAQVDVTELLHDPDFTDDMQLISRVPSVSSYGQNSFVETTVNSYGSIQPANERTVEKLPEAMRVKNLSSFWFFGKIVASESGKYSSILVFQGVRYQVLTVSDFSNWGTGYTEGVCVAEVPAP